MAHAAHHAVRNRFRQPLRAGSARTLALTALLAGAMLAPVTSPAPAPAEAAPDRAGSAAATPRNVALGAAVAASSNYQGSGWTIGAATDGVRGPAGWSSWSNVTVNHTEWVRLDLGTAYPLDRVDLFARSDGTNVGLGFPIDFTIAVSTDGLAWSTVATRVDYARPTAAAQSFTFPASSARYLRISGSRLRPDQNGDHVLQFAEVEAYGAGIGTPPTTIPALREWTPGTGQYAFGAASRLVAEPALLDEAATFAEDLAEVLGRTPAVVPVGVVPACGDVVLKLGAADASLGTEGYRLTVDCVATISANGETGAFYGTRTLLQLFRTGPTVSYGTARDWPAYRERGVMIDVGRKYFTVDWLRWHIKDLAYAKLNYLHLHLSDNLGFRLESTLHPEVVSAQHYTKQQIRDLVTLAARYKVTIVPEIDMPGHLDAVLAAHPDLKLRSRTGAVHNSFIDLSKPESYALMRDLITEAMELFPAPYWHVGADEYVTNYADYPQLLSYARANYGANATAKDTYYGFVNWANDIVRAAGKTMRMWNDGIRAGDGTIMPDSDIVVEYWDDLGLTPQQLLDRGHTVLNASWTPTYYVIGTGARPDNAYLNGSWTVDTFEGGTVITDSTRNLGSTLHVWCDVPERERPETVATVLRDPLRGLAQRTWGTPKPAPTYGASIPIFDAVGRAPGWPGAAVTGDLARNRPVTASSQETSDLAARNAVDGDSLSAWSSAFADPQWIRVDLGAVRPVNRVLLRWQTAYARTYQIQTSTDGQRWATVSTVTGGDGGVDDLRLAASGRYVRVHATVRGTQWGYSLWGLEVY
ncbi:family 20 glycosylhydrolase [Plantactinospora endophytica]|uniref:F5/8 type C domain-containing protein n=1 Tax=Plantactinospora endophytica TaxID=673535 RepID=A0ABQ4E7T6_9ACTN|nr:family 20 glycosylhydrolase [Plantactinospora endophytica]GIG90724.1 hypothetical protein Pen02_56600 [Plantactinospora endophytica]